MGSAGPLAQISNAKTTLFFSLSVILCFSLLTQFAGAADDRTWTEYGGTLSNSHYSSITQINRSNVSQLQVVWSYPTRDGMPYQFNPIVVDGLMYVLASNNSLIALDAKTGKEVWIHEKLGGIQHRGISYWESKDHQDRRLIFQLNQTLQEIDAKTGKSILTFGSDGVVNLREGLDRDPKTITRIQTGTPGKVFENLYLVGSSTGEGYFSPPGDLRAFDVVTGKKVWQFHTIPKPGEYGYETWPKDAYKYIGGVNTWGEITVDEKRGIAYFPIGAPTYDFYGADRIGMNLFADCLLALDARTGKRLWHFQFVHHDLWDYDAVSAPQLITVHQNGKQIDAVAEATKQGFVYAFDRVTGKPLWPIEERPVPKSDIPQEQAWPTQPFPTLPPPFARQKFTAADINPYVLTPEERKHWTEVVAAARNKGLFTPAALEDTIEMPGNRGGNNWGGTSSDPAKGLLYVTSVDAPSILKLAAQQPDLTVGVNGFEMPKGMIRGVILSPGQKIYLQNCKMCHGEDRQGQGGIPSLAGVVSRLGDEGVTDVVSHGRGQMPPFPSIKGPDLDALISYLATADAASGDNPTKGATAAATPSKTEEDRPVAGSGGAPAAVELANGIKPETYGMMEGAPYPAGVDAPLQRYYSGWNIYRPIINPPWSTLTAYDMNKGTIKWQVPLGEDPLAAAEGVKQMTGIMAEQREVIVTATGLLFIATSDGYLRAFDADTGKQLWSAELPASSNGLSSFYELDGRAYLVVNASGANGFGFGMLPNLRKTKVERGTKAYVVFALPTDLKTAPGGGDR